MSDDLSLKLLFFSLKKERGVSGTERHTPQKCPISYLSLDPASCLDSKRVEIEFERELDSLDRSQYISIPPRRSWGKVQTAEILFETRFMPLLFSLDIHIACAQIGYASVFTLIKRRGRPVFPICVTQLHSTSGTTLAIACICLCMCSGFVILVLLVFPRFVDYSKIAIVFTSSHHISLSLSHCLFLYPFLTRTHYLRLTGSVLLF